MAVNALLGRRHSSHDVGSSGSHGGPAGDLVALGSQFLGGGQHGGHQTAQQAGPGGNSGGGGGSSAGHLVEQLAANLLSGPDKPAGPQNYSGGPTQGQHVHQGGLAGAVMGGLAHMVGGRPGHEQNVRFRYRTGIVPTTPLAPDANEQVGPRLWLLTLRDRGKLLWRRSHVSPAGLRPNAWPSPFWECLQFCFPEPTAAFLSTRPSRESGERLVPSPAGTGARASGSHICSASSRPGISRHTSYARGHAAGGWFVRTRNTQLRTATATTPAVSPRAWRLWCIWRPVSVRWPTTLSRTLLPWPRRLREPLLASVLLLISDAWRSHFVSNWHLFSRAFCLRRAPRQRPPVTLRLPDEPQTTWRVRR